MIARANRRLDSAKRAAMAEIGSWPETLRATDAAPFIPRTKRSSGSAPGSPAATASRTGEIGVEQQAELGIHFRPPPILAACASSLTSCRDGNGMTPTCPGSVREPGPRGSTTDMIELSGRDYKWTPRWQPIVLGLGPRLPRCYHSTPIQGDLR